MCFVQNGLTALSIAQRLGYISVVEILRHITDVTVTPAAAEDKYKVIAPETMQEAPMSDSEEEGGEYNTPYVSPAIRYFVAKHIHAFVYFCAGSQRLN